MNEPSKYAFEAAHGSPEEVQCQINAATAELQAENEALWKASASFKESIQELRAEKSWLEQKFDRACQDVDNLRAENQTLIKAREEGFKKCQDLASQRDKLAAEMQRLKTALELAMSDESATQRADRAEAENKALKLDFTIAINRAKDLETQRDKLAAEVDRLLNSRLQREHDALRDSAGRAEAERDTLKAQAESASATANQVAGQLFIVRERADHAEAAVRDNEETMKLYAQRCWKAEAAAAQMREACQLAMHYCEADSNSEKGCIMFLAETVAPALEAALATDAGRDWVPMDRMDSFIAICCPQCRESWKAFLTKLK